MFRQRSGVCVCVVYPVNGTSTTHWFADIEPIWKYDEAMLSELAKVYSTTLEEMKKPLQCELA